MTIVDVIWRIGATVLLAACSAQEVTPLIERDVLVEREQADGWTDRYVRLVQIGRRHLREGRLRSAEENFESAAAELLFERANYEVWVELAEAKCRLGKTAEALALLDDYEMALKVDFEKEQCMDDWGPEMTVSCSII